jgi:ribonuclease P protein component
MKADLHNNTTAIGRLRQQAAFDRLRGLRDAEHRWTSKSLSLQICPDETLGDAALKIGISASRKTAKRAVDRNRMKRRLRVAAASVMPMHAKMGLNYLISARSEALTRTMDELKDDLAWCLRKLGTTKP